MYRGYRIQPARQTGGKAGKGRNKTSTIQVINSENCVVKQIRFNVNEPGALEKATRKAREHVDQLVGPFTCYVIVNSCRDQNGNLIPCILQEGESGYYKTDWEWGPDPSQAWTWAIEKNQVMGITPEDVEYLYQVTMFPRMNTATAREIAWRIVSHPDYIGHPEII